MTEHALRPGGGLTLSGTTRVWALAAAMATAAALVATVALPPQSDLSYPVRMPWWALALTFLLAELLVLRVPFRREMYPLSLNELALALGLFLVAPPDLFAAQIAGTTAALVVRRVPSVQLALRLAQVALSTTVALAAFHALVETASAGPRIWGATLLAAGLSAGPGGTAAALAAALEAGEPVRRLGSTLVGVIALATIASMAMAVAALELLRVSAWLPSLTAPPLVACAVAGWALLARRTRRERPGTVHDAMRRIQQSPDLDAAAAELLASVRRAFRAEYAELLLADETDDEVLHGRLVGDAAAVVASMVASPKDTELLRLIGECDAAAVIPARHGRHPLEWMLVDRTLVDAMVTPLRGEKGVYGALVVGNGARPFTSQDARLFTAFANEASVLLENDRLAQSLARVIELKEQLRHQAFHDATTGLPNRALFTEHVRTALLRTARGGRAILLFLDLDDFKTVNDSLGHAAGDELIAVAAARLRELVRPQDVPARLGGDEFGVLLEDVGMAEAERIARRVVQGMAKPFPLRGRHVSVHASVGLAAASPDVSSADELLCNADVAMYAAKAQGKRRYAIYERDMTSRVRARLELGAALERAVDDDEFGVHYQPIVSLASGRIVGFEALVRWHRPGHGVLPPHGFLAIAEETGLIGTITRVVLRQACRQAKLWQDEFATERLAVSVNLSPSDLRSDRLDFEVASVLRETGLEPSRLIIEVTESAAMEDPDASIDMMLRLRELGVRLALDDFGTGHSSLSYLQELPIDVLKIAKPFIDQLGGGRGAKLAETIVWLGEALGLEVVAEGIEQPHQVQRLVALDCALGQGFHFAEPLDAKEARAYLRSFGGTLTIAHGRRLRRTPRPQHEEEREEAMVVEGGRGAQRR